jgi:diguanylate cyclase (GGDEF)-like protein/PAS domain S-box-containing protein
MPSVRLFRRLPIFWGSFVLFLLVIVGGLVLTDFVSRFGEEMEREELKLLAATAVASFDTDTIRKLRGNPSDIGTEAFDHVRKQLQKIRGANPNSRFVYLMGWQKDRIVFLADAEPPESKDYSAPGEVYKEASPALYRIFSQGKPFTEGPYQDHWGVWVTGHAPLIDSRTGQVIATLGIDFRADQWLASVSRYRWFSIALTALVAGIMALLLIGIHFQGRFSSRIKHLNQDLERELEERRRAEQGLRLAAAVIDNTTEGIVVTRMDGTIRKVNQSFEQITGWGALEAVGRTMEILKSGEHDEEFFHEMSKILAETGKWKGEIWNRRKNGELYPQATTINALKDSDGAVDNYAVIFSDVTEQKQLENKLRSLSAQDGLTGLHNRRAFDETFLKEWRRAMRESSPLSVIMLDIDCFKNYNDCYGHLEGDACIQQVAQVLKGCVRRAADFSARYGGEEFVVILPETDQMGARGVANRIREEIQSLAIPHGNSEVAPVVTVSIGFATEFPQREAIAVNLIERADKALYQAKSLGRNRVETL